MELTKELRANLAEIEAEVDDDFDDELPEPPEHDHVEDRVDLDPVLLARGISGAEWGARYPNCAASQQRRAAGGGVAVNIHHELAVITAGLLAVTRNEFGYVMKQPQTGAYVCRPIGGTNTASNHSVCTAIDINWQENQFSYNPSFTIPMSVVRKWEQYGFSWGGRWSGKKDTMHFEWMKTIAEARRQTQLFLRDHTSAPPPPPPPPLPPPDKVHPRHNPPWVFQPIVDEVIIRHSGQVWFYQLGLDGSLYNHVDAPFVRGMNGSPHFQGRRAAHLNVVDGPKFLQITAHTGEKYHVGP